MNRTKAILTLMLVLLGSMASAPALAFGHGGHFGGRAHFGVFIGGPGLWGPWYYPPYYGYSPYYYPPAVAVPAGPTQYVEQGGAAAQAAPAQQGYWYYCTDAKAYYPYVKECPGGWQRVAPQPPGG